MITPALLASLGPALKLLKAAGLDPGQVLAEPVVTPRMRASIPAIAAAMADAGVTLPDLAVDGLTDADKRLVIRDAQWRAWRSVFDFNAGGVAADAFRDRQEKKIVAVVAPQVNAQTEAPELVRLVVEATLRLTF